MFFLTLVFLYGKTTKEQLVTWGTQGRAEAEDLWKKLSSILGTVSLSILTLHTTMYSLL